LRPEVGRQGAGFTLLEVLVALSLFGLIAVAVAGGIRFGARVWDSGRETAQASGAVHQAQYFLRRQLSNAMLAPEDLRSAEGLPFFAGEEDRLLLSAPWLTSFDRAGIYQLEIALAPNDELGHDLVVRWRALTAALEGATFDDAEQARILLPNVEGIDIRYFGTQEGKAQPAWHGRWDDQNRLPDLVAMEVALPQQAKIAWPQLLIKVRTGGD
jgi:general secretion pathway protein J